MLLSRPLLSPLCLFFESFFNLSNWRRVTQDLWFFCRFSPSPPSSGAGRRVRRVHFLAPSGQPPQLLLRPAGQTLNNAPIGVHASSSLHGITSSSLPPSSCRVWWSPAQETLWLRIPTSAWSRCTTTKRWVQGLGTRYGSRLVSGFIWSSCRFDENWFADALEAPCGAWKQLLRRKNILIKHFKFTPEMTF